MANNYGYQNEIDIFNKEINHTRIIVDMIDRFIIRAGTRIMMLMY